MEIVTILKTMKSMNWSQLKIFCKAIHRLLQKSFDDAPLLEYNLAMKDLALW